jgi:hypothetical protein
MSVVHGFEIFILGEKLLYMEHINMYNMESNGKLCLVLQIFA